MSPSSFEPPNDAPNEPQMISTVNLKMKIFKLIVKYVSGHKKAKYTFLLFLVLTYFCETKNKLPINIILCKNSNDRKFKF